VEEELSVPPPAAPAAPAQVGKTTLVSGPKETEDLRRKIARPSVPDLTLEELGEDEEDDAEIEEFSLDVPPEPEPDAPPPAPRPLAPAPRPAPSSAPAVVQRVPTLDTPPVSVQLPSTPPGQTDITIPVEVTVGDGAAQVAIHIRLTLSLKIKP
jgi:hypothetical protein